MVTGDSIATNLPNNGGQAMVGHPDIITPYRTSKIKSPLPVISLNIYRSKNNGWTFNFVNL
jgi:hypothetical protein